MSQEPYKDDNKTKLPRFSNRSNNNDSDNSPRKGPRFSIYWVYAIIFAVLIGFQVFGPFTPTTESIPQSQFEQMLQQGDVKRYVIVSNRNVVRVTLNEQGLQKYRSELGKSESVNEEGPHFFVKIGSVDSFKDDMRDFYQKYPAVKNVGTVDTERDWFSPIISTLLPILIFIAIWILLMR